MQAEYGAPRSGWSSVPTRSAHAEGYMDTPVHGKASTPWQDRKKDLWHAATAAVCGTQEALHLT